MVMQRNLVVRYRKVKKSLFLGQEVALLLFLFLLRTAHVHLLLPKHNASILLQLYKILNSISYFYFAQKVSTVPL